MAGLVSAAQSSFDAGALASDRRPQWLSRLRDRAMATFSSLGIPTSKDERWKYTSLRRLAEVDWRPAENRILSPQEAQELAGLDALAVEATTLVFVNGFFAPILSRLTASRGVETTSLRQMIASGEEGRDALLAEVADYHRESFVALNTALFTDAAVLRVQPEVTVEQPIHLLFISAGEGVPSATHPRSLIRVGRGSQATVLESYVRLGDAPIFGNAVSEIRLDEGATLQHVRRLDGGREASTIATAVVSQKRESCYESRSLTIGGNLVRNQLHVALEEEGARCDLRGLSLGRGSELVDTMVVVDHQARSTSSHQSFGTVLDGKATSTFHGRIIVGQTAAGTDASQRNRNLLLARTATANTRPQLEIYADDVKCSHGATVGQLDSEALFYLRSRGFSEQEATKTLTMGFAREWSESVESTPLREQLERGVRRWLNDPMLTRSSA